MQTDDIAAWLTAILDEDEARARAAIADDGGQDGGFEDDFDRLTGHGPLAVLPRFGEAAAAMIVWQTPRRALAQIAADRAILELHTGAHSCPELKTGTYPDDWPEGASWGKAGSAWRHASNEYFYEDAPCPTIRLKVEQYADRPGYNEQWRP
jgi:hypothetical protein